jgi:3-isopropylmalate/(R)-2-methylmalate dehydratase small subunit
MALESIHTVQGRAVVVPGDDIDTDRIIPARYMKVVTFDGLGEFLFRDVRFDEEGNARKHPLNDARFSGASVLISGANFGCGSSREHAPQSIYRAGFRAVVAESFAEIFFGNSTTLGMPCVSLERADLERLAALIAAEPQLEIAIDLEALELRAGGRRFAVTMPASAREALLTGGWDPLGELLTGTEAVDRVAERLPYLGRSRS